MKLEKLIKVLGEDTIKELEAKDKDALEQVIVNAEKSMQQAVEELEANAKYQEIKELKKAAEVGKREVNKRQKALIALALYLLSEKGE